MFWVMHLGFCFVFRLLFMWISAWLMAQRLTANERSSLHRTKILRCPRQRQQQWMQQRAAHHRRKRKHPWRQQMSKPVALAGRIKPTLGHRIWSCLVYLFIRLIFNSSWKVKWILTRKKTFRWSWGAMLAGEGPFLSIKHGNPNW